MNSIQTLPLPSSLSSAVLSFLDDKLKAEQDLVRASTLVSELGTQCSDLDLALIDLNRRLESILASYVSFSDRIDCLFVNINGGLANLSSSTCVSTSHSDAGRGREEGVEKKEQTVGEELQTLAKEVARVETVRSYAETALKLDSSIGDIEDAVSSVMNKNLKKQSSVQNSEEMRMHAIEALKQTEVVLTRVTKARPQWARLVSAVDHRVDRALAILRPQAIADHRALLASLGWPPPVSSLTSSDPDARKSTDVRNPLFTMQGHLKQQYCENFLALCSLQELQRQRKSRQLEGHNREVALHQPLWAIEELVSPLAVVSQRYFSKWVDKPEFIFALVYKITRDYVDSMDELLQPLVDEAKLPGYSCREEWISGMVNSLSMYLAKEVFPIYVGQLEEESASGTESQARISWLHLVDLMISFDQRVKLLISHSGILISLEDDVSLQKVSSLSVFCDRPDWVDLWAEIEVGDMLKKLKPKMNDERNWTVKVQGEVVLSGPEGCKIPAVSTAVVRCLSSVIDRSRSLPIVSLRSRFLRLTGAPIIQNFLDCLILRCQEAEGLTALTDDDALIKVVNCVNSACYFESLLKEWCEDVFLLEMGLHQNDQLGIPVSESIGSEGLLEGSSNCIFNEEIGKLEKFRAEWVDKLSIVVLRGFDARSRDYMKNRKKWQEKSEDTWTVSKTLAAALDYMQGKMSIIEGNLNRMDFVAVWRSLAASVDRLLFNGVLMSNAKFSDGGVERFSSDVEVLFGVFGVWCLRPEGFFPRISGSLKLLKMGEKELKDSIAGGEKWLKNNGIRHLAVAEAEKIVKSRVFNS